MQILLTYKKLKKYGQVKVAHQEGRAEVSWQKYMSKSMHG